MSSQTNINLPGFLNEKLTNPRDAEYARQWNKMLCEKEYGNSYGNSYGKSYGNSYGSSLPSTTSNWGTISNGSSIFSSSYYG